MRATLPPVLAIAALAVNASHREVRRPPSDPARPMYAEPAISPDRAEITFVSGGDLWTVPASGGVARLLVSGPATESRPAYSPDGARLAFVSTRTGNGDIYVLTLATGDLRRLTFGDQPDRLDAWSPDGRWIYFSSSAQDIAAMNDVFRVRSDGGTPMPVSADRYANEYWAAPAPDGRRVALTARALVSAQWWRRGHSHLDESEIWVLDDAATMRYHQVTTGQAKDAWPMWGADGTTLYFVSDRDGAENIWAHSGRGPATEITHFRSGRVLWPTASSDGSAIVFERDFRIWLLDPASGDAHEVPITLRGAPDAPVVEHLRLSDRVQELALSPDGLKAAFVVHGEIFSASAKDGGDAFRVTRTPTRELQVQWTPDSRKLVYVADREGSPQLVLYDFTTRTETGLTRDPAGDVNPRVSPDGNHVAFIRGGRQLCVVDLDTREVRRLAPVYFNRFPFTADRDVAWSPDGRWLAYSSATDGMFRTVFVVPAAGGPARQVSFLANVFGGSISWSPDGRFLLYGTGQRTEPGQLARVDLVSRTPQFREDRFADLFTLPTRTSPAPRSPRDSARARGARPGAARDSAAPPAPVEITFEDIRQRLSIVPVGLDVDAQVLSPDGKSVLLVAREAGQQNLYVYSLDELAREAPVARQLTSTAGGKADAQFSPDGREVWYLERGRIATVNVESRQTRHLAVTAEMDVDFEREKMVMFDEAWRYLRDVFADSTMNGADWAAVRSRLEPYAAGAKTPDETRRLINLMLGELNASHLGVSAPSGTAAAPFTGRLGLDFDRAEYERTGRLRVAAVVPLGPAAVAGGIAAGEYLVAVDGTRLEGSVSLDSVLANTIGRRVTVTLSRGADGGSPRDVALRPVNTGTEKQLRYRAWVEAKRAYVARVSHGRLGYVHMPDMGAGSLRQLYVDLDVENRAHDGVVIDIRHNNGGFVNVYAIDVLARRGYLTMTFRGATPAPARSILGQRALGRPTILVTDQHSLSDAEDFTEGYRSLHLGTVVGEPTAGWIIYTSGAALIDGSALRLPAIQIRGSDGAVMEMHPRPVDIRVDRPVGESYGDHDSQLDAAVAELLRQLAGSPANERPRP
jgi:tricorn protease